MKNTIIVLVIVILIGFGAYFLIRGTGTFGPNSTVPPNQEPATGIVGTIDTTSTSTVPPTAPIPPKTETVIGKSVLGNDITAYHYGAGEKKILFIGGVHGGYSWNTALVAYELMDYLKANPSALSSNVEVTVIPVLNPDGLNKVAGSTGRFVKADVSSSATVLTAGRFNGNNVDLNRNFDCDWQTMGKWRNVTVSGGSQAFSEPESSALQDYVEKYQPTAVVVWYSAAGGVFASNCHDGVLVETRALTNLYAEAAGYPAYENFDFYEITGDMVNWLAKQKIPAISVLLSTHDAVEWDKNRAGVDALLKYYAR